MIRKILLHPPAWLERILSKSKNYRAWYIQNAWRMLTEQEYRGEYE